jgi:hypothetical protein
MRRDFRYLLVPESKMTVEEARVVVQRLPTRIARSYRLIPLRQNEAIELSS